MFRFRWKESLFGMVFLVRGIFDFYNGGYGGVGGEVVSVGS